MKKLIIFIPSIEKAGVEKNLYILCGYLIKKINNIYIVTANNNFHHKFNNKIKIICPKNRFWNNKSRLLKSLYCFFLILRFFKSGECLLFSFQANLFAIIISRILNFQIILRLNTSPNKYINNNFKKFFFKKIYKLADEIIVNSKKFMVLLKKQLNIRAKFIYNPIINNIKIKKNIKNLKNDLRILNIGRLTDQKDQITLLRALNLLNKNNIIFSAKIIGSGYKYNFLTKYIIENNLEKNIKLMGYRKNAYRFMTKSNLFILSSKYEGLPNVLIEAQQSNLPIISSNCPSGPSEILINGKLGELYPVGNYKALYRKILKFNHNKKELLMKSILARKYITRFNTKKNCHKYYEIIKRFL